MSTTYVIKDHSGSKIPLKLWAGRDSTCMIFIGGSGDTKDTLSGLVNKSLEKLKYDFVTFSFVGAEEGKPYTLNRQTENLETVLDYLIESKKYEELILVGTSDGAFSVCSVLVEERYSKLISNVIFWILQTTIYRKAIARLGTSFGTDMSSIYRTLQL